MRRSDTRPPRGGHPATSLEQTIVGVFGLMLTAVVVAAAAQFPQIAVLAVAGAIGIVTGRYVTRLVYRRLRQSTHLSVGSEARPQAD